MIYVMGERRTGLVKIGSAANPVVRLRQIQAGYPRMLTLQLALPGNRRTEAWLHSHFKQLRVSEREWFDFGRKDAVCAVVDAQAKAPQDKEAGPPVVVKDAQGAAQKAMAAAPVVDPPLLLTVQQISRLIGVPKHALYRLIEDGVFGELPDAGGRIWVPKARVLTYLNERAAVSA